MTQLIFHVFLWLILQHGSSLYGRSYKTYFFSNHMKIVFRRSSVALTNFLNIDFEVYQGTTATRNLCCLKF